MSVLHSYSRKSKQCAQVAKLVDALALGASEVTHGGSSPLLGTLFGFDENE